MNGEAHLAFQFAHNLDPDRAGSRHLRTGIIAVLDIRRMGLEFERPAVGIH